ncbi:P-loop NTPase fold protein [Hymenobacter lucidus]|uniref:KAP NTPase domain-containing protein n=1 Tax=Hymenobacter lucidus TaxID=2880930 RepID=A0ABS8AK62_9BACT|nr:P-loop NTPase fold protein [Hymenobacter lucidus]MCB2406477.1 hypothetical protein [Hymenobacter lucidus]
MEHFNISTVSEESRFSAFIQDPANERMIFSGSFGTGKTHFLNKFFSENKNYFSVSVLPVNYSISSNEDIFKLIKFDVLYDLFTNKGTKFYKEEASLSIKLGMIAEEGISSHLFLAIKTLLKFHSITNRNDDTDTLANTVDLASDLYEKAMNNKKISQIIATANDLNGNERVQGFVKDILNTYLFEEDFITDYISDKLIEHCSDINNKKTSILVIDDLDRIDPEHAFRLFNIFSAHLNYRNEQKNKFGFDKVIFVCDIENIKNIFYSRYGLNVDFNGYIDKFFSTEIFYFNNNINISNSIKTILDSIKYENEIGLSSLDYTIKTESPLYVKGKYFYGILPYLVNHFVKTGKLGIRRLSYLYGKTYHIKAESFSIPQRQPITNIDSYGIITLEILSWIFGGADALEKALSSSKDYYKTDQKNESALEQDHNLECWFFCFFLPIILYREGNLPREYDLLDPQPGTDFSLRNGDKTITKFSYILKKEGDLFNRRREEDYGYIAKITSPTSLTRHSLYELLHQSFQVVKTHLKNRSN